MEYEEFMNMQCVPAPAKDPQTNDECMQASENGFQDMRILKAIVKAVKLYTSGLEADAASAKSKYDADVSRLEAMLAEQSSALEEKEKEFADKDVQYKTRLASAEEKYRKQEAALQEITAKCARAEGEKRAVETELNDLKKNYSKQAEELLCSFYKPGMPTDVRINAYLKYLEAKPGNLCIAGIVHNNIGAMLGNEFKYEGAKEHLLKAISFAQQECIADPSNDSAKERLERYERRLEDCIYNIDTMKSSAKVRLAAD